MMNVSSQYSCNQSLFEMLDGVCATSLPEDDQQSQSSWDDTVENTYIPRDFPVGEAPALKNLRDKGYALVMKLDAVTKLHAEKEQVHQWEKYRDQVNQLAEGTLRPEKIKATPDEFVTWGADGPFYKQVNCLVDIVNQPSSPFHTVLPIVRKAVEVDVPPVAIAGFAIHRTAKTSTKTPPNIKKINELFSGLQSAKLRAQIERISHPDESHAISSAQKDGAHNDFDLGSLNIMIEKAEQFLLNQAPGIDAHYGKSGAADGIEQLALETLTTLKEIQTQANSFFSAQDQDRAQVAQMMASSKA